MLFVIKLETNWHKVIRMDRGAVSHQVDSSRFK